MPKFICEACSNPCYAFFELGNGKERAHERGVDVAHGFPSRCLFATSFTPNWREL